MNQLYQQLQELQSQQLQQIEDPILIENIPEYHVTADLVSRAQSVKTAASAPRTPAAIQSAPRTAPQSAPRTPAAIQSA
ncbi:MAG: hypothetical protein EBU84_14585, partial [Actinobacteria bacterium]|nr:hypothetical protein [Actinomycetota bacterium]